MTKSEKKLFTEQVEKLFDLMKLMRRPPQDDWMNKVVVVDNIKQLYSSFIIHKLMFIGDEEHGRMHIRHDVREVRNRIARNVLYEGYRFHPGRKNKFELTSLWSGQSHIKLFDRWSKIDMDDLLKKLELKMVELI